MKHAEEPNAAFPLRRALLAARMQLWEWDFRSGGVIRAGDTVGTTGFRDGSAEAFLARIASEDAGRYRDAVAAAKAGENGGRLDVEFRFRRPDGQTLWL